MNMEAINWNQFDHIYCIHYMPYVDRLQSIMKQLKTIGILDTNIFSFYNTVPNTYYDRLYEILLDKKIIINGKDSGNFLSKNVFNLAINQFNLLNQALELSYQKILILEDDIEFKNTSLVAKYINSIPNDFDVVNFDWIIPENDFKFISSLTIINDNFYNISSGTQGYYKNAIRIKNPANASCIALSNKAMRNIIQNQMEIFKNADYYTTNRQMTKDYRLRYYMSCQKICNQSRLFNGNNNCDWVIQTEDKLESFIDKIICKENQKII